MIRPLICSTLLIAAAAMPAAARPMSSAMSCGAVQNLVSRSGAIVLSFTPTTYDRVVAGQRFCLPSEVTEPLWVPTRDARQCFAGYTCKEGETWRW